MKITANKIIFGVEDWITGLNQQSGVGYPTALKGADTLSNFNPFRYFGKACPGFNPADATNVAQITTMLVSGLLASDDSAYAVGGALFHRITPVSGAVTNSGSFPYTITGATTKDIVEYNVGGAARLFISWYDSTDGDVAIVTMNGTSPTVDIDFMSTVPTGAAALAKNEDMPMKVGSDGKLYIGVGVNIHQYDGATDTLVPNKLVLPTGYKVKSFAIWEDMDYIVVFAQGRNEVRAFFWDYVSGQHLYSKKIEGNACGGGFQNYKGTFGVFSNGLTVDSGSTTRRVHLNIFNGARFERVTSLPTASTPMHGGVDVLGDMIRANCGSKIYTYGSPYAGLSVGVHHIATIGGTGSGMLLNTSNNVLLVSSGTTTSGGLEVLSSNFAGNTIYQSSFAEPLFAPGKKGLVTAMTAVFDKTCSGNRSISLATVSRDGSTCEYISGLMTITSKNLVYKRIGGIGDFINRAFDAFQLQLVWSDGDGVTDAPIVSQVAFDYKQINI